MVPLGCPRRGVGEVRRVRGGGRVGSGPAQLRFRRRRRYPARKCRQRPLPAAPRCARERCPSDCLRGTAEKQAGRTGAALPQGALCHPPPLTDTLLRPRASRGSPAAPTGSWRPPAPANPAPLPGPAGLELWVCAVPREAAASLARAGRPRWADIFRGTACPMAVQGSMILSHGFNSSCRRPSAAQDRWGWWICTRESAAQEQRCYTRDQSAQTSAAFISPCCYWIGRNTLWRAWIPWGCIMISLSEKLLMKVTNESLSDPCPQCQEGLLGSWITGKISSLLHCPTWAALSSADPLHIRHWGHFHSITICSFFKPR